MEITKLLKSDHQEVKDLFKQAMPKGEVDADIAQEICSALKLHMEAEEKLVYPEAEQIKQAEELTEESYEEHTQAKALIRKLESGKLDETEFKVTFEMLQLAIEHHVEEEESELFPVLREKFSSQELAELGEKVQKFKEQKQKGRKAVS
jgi:hemerythrin-like domain-containing protein